VADRKGCPDWHSRSDSQRLAHPLSHSILIRNRFRVRVRVRIRIRICIRSCDRSDHPVVRLFLYASTAGLGFANLHLGPAS
jgi:hypothetical protein